MESNLLLEQYSWYKKQQLAKAPFECLLNADIEPNPHQVNAFCAAIQALKTGGIILADEVGLGKTIEAVVKGRFLKNPSTVEYKVINDTVLYMKEMNK